MGKFWICKLSNFLIYFNFVLKIVNASTHWIVTENGRIQSQLDSAFHMRRPYDLLSLLEQEKRAQMIENLYKEMLGRKAAIDVEWAGLESASDLEVRLYESDKDCLRAGKPLTDTDLYISVADDGFGREGISLNNLLPIEEKEDAPDYPDCKQVIDLDFSMSTFPHLQALSWNLSSSSEFLETQSLGEQRPQLIAAGLMKNRTSWFLYNLAAIYWRTRGNAQKAIECAKRAIHFSPRQYRDVPLLNLGCIMQQARCPAEAAIVLHAAVDHSPKRPMAHYVLANVYAILGDYNRSVACYDNALSLKPRWTLAERNRYAVLCHHKLEISLDQLHRSLQGILTQLHDYQELQEHWLKYQEELMFQQVPLHVKLQDYEHDTLAALLNHRDKCVSMIHDGNTVLNCDQLFAHHLQIDITLSLQVLLKNVESQAQKISEQMSRRLTTLNSGTYHSHKVDLWKLSEENDENFDQDGELDLYIDSAEEPAVSNVGHDNVSVTEVLNKLKDKLKDDAMDIVDDIVDKHRKGWFNKLKFKELLFLMNEDKHCEASKNPLKGDCSDHKLDLWLWDNENTENQLLSIMGISENEKHFENSCFEIRCHVLSSIIITWFQLGKWNLETKITNSNETPKCSKINRPLLTQLTLKSYGEKNPEPRLKPLLSVLVDDANISVSDISSRVANALKGTASRTVAMAAALYWRLVGDAEQTVACLQLAVASASDSTKAGPLHDFAHILLTLGHHKEALLLATLALQVAPDSLFVHTELFHIYNAMGDTTKAVQFGKSAVSLQEQARLLKKH